VEGERSESQKTYLDFCSFSPEKKRTKCNLGDDRDILDQLLDWSGIFVFQTVKKGGCYEVEVIFFSRLLSLCV